jgi:hypothetical protein
VGGVISPLLANLYVHWFDKIFHAASGPAQWARAKLVRYADDFVVLARHQGPQLRAFIEDHVNMRLAGRFIPRQTILDAVETYKVIEEYPDDKYLPSYLLLGQCGGDAFHALFAADVDRDTVRVVTAYRPDAEEWEPDLKTRRRKS